MQELHKPISPNSFRASQTNVTQFKAKTNQKQKSHVYTIRSTPILFLFNSKETGYGPLETLKT